MDNSPEGTWIDPDTGELYRVIDRQEQLCLLYEYMDALRASGPITDAHTTASEHFREHGHRLASGCCRAS